MQHEWETMLRLLGVVTGQGPDADLAAIDDFIALEAARRETVTAGSPAEGMEPAAVVAELGERRGPERILDLLLRCGPYGAGFGTNGRSGDSDGPALSLDALEAAPHGIDLGPLAPRLPEMLRTPSGRVELAPPAITADLDRLASSLDAEQPEMVLIGRRHLRSNNSWLHNLPHLVRGADRCTMHVSPADAERLGLADGARAQVSSRAGSLEVPVEVTDSIMSGVDLDPARLGPRRRGRPHGGRRRPQRRQLEPALGRDRGRPALGQRGPQRDSRQRRARRLRRAAAGAAAAAT